MSFIVQMFEAIATGIQQHKLLGRREKLYLEQARQSEAEAAADAARIEARGQRIQASAIARAGAGGVTEGQSALDVLVDNAREIGMDIASTKYRGAMSAWGLREGAKEADWAQRMTAIMWIGKGLGAAAQGYDKYAYKPDTSRTERLEATRDNFFTNQADEQDYDAWGRGDVGWGGSSWIGGDYGGNEGMASRGDL